METGAPCFGGLTTAQAARIIEAMEGLPADVLDFVRDRVQFVAPTGTIARAVVSKPRGHTRMIIALPGVDGRQPIAPVVLFHEIAHAILAHPYSTSFGWRRSRIDPHVRRPKSEVEAWKLVQAWLGSPTPARPEVRRNRPHA